jgi:hypothetical protein
VWLPEYDAPGGTDIPEVILGVSRKCSPNEGLVQYSTVPEQSIVACTVQFSCQRPQHYRPWQPPGTRRQMGSDVR